ncbi:MAG TPA: DivIVA domain-containing protein [Acidimicrobiales bacterium]|nr:DivIVA domain-containing protein [Acidimicrobiales bacterium]
MVTDLSPQRLREAQFAEAWRGYRMDQVRELLDHAAEALEDLRNRARHADERAAVAERRLVERAADDEVSRTLVLAQRTADTAVSEARAEAARLLGDAEERSRAMLAEVQLRAEQLEREMESRAEAALAELNDRRAALEADVALLADYVERQRSTLADELRQLLSWLDGGGHLDAPPVALTGAMASATGSGTTGTVPAAPDAPAPDQGGYDPSASPAGPFAPGGPSTSGGADHDGDGPQAEGPGGGPALADVGGDDPASRTPGATGAAGEVGDTDADNADGAASSESKVAGAIDDDPFLAELRRAVEDPEPLGPRDDDGVWAEETQLYDQDITASGRFRRRRR